MTDKVTGLRPVGIGINDPVIESEPTVEVGDRVVIFKYNCRVGEVRVVNRIDSNGRPYMVSPKQYFVNQLTKPKKGGTYYKYYRKYKTPNSLIK